MKISHETPFCLLNESRTFNDFDYALVHLFESYPDYFQFFKDSIAMGREVILDNSVFELGMPFEDVAYKEWIKKLQPTYAIIPDKFMDSKFTIRKVLHWAPWLKSIGVKSIGVIQGTTLNDIVECYKQISSHVDKVAISFAQPLFEQLYPLENIDSARMYGRLYLINYLKSCGVLDSKKSIHLLGISLPQEVAFYKAPAYSFITSVDSSSPIVHGLLSTPFNDNGLSAKLSTKLVDLFDCPTPTEIQMHIISHNIQIFKKLSLCE